MTDIVSPRECNAMTGNVSWENAMHMPDSISSRGLHCKDRQWVRETWTVLTKAWNARFGSPELFDKAWVEFESSDLLTKVWTKEFVSLNCLTTCKVEFESSELLTKDWTIEFESPELFDNLQSKVWEFSTVKPRREQQSSRGLQCKWLTTKCKWLPTQCKWLTT